MKPRPLLARVAWVAIVAAGCTAPLTIGELRDAAPAEPPFGDVPDLPSADGAADQDIHVSAEGSTVASD